MAFSGFSRAALDLWERLLNSIPGKRASCSHTRFRHAALRIKQQDYLLSKRRRAVEVGFYTCRKVDSHVRCACTHPSPWTRPISFHQLRESLPVILGVMRLTVSSHRRQTMQRPSSYYAFSRCDSQVWTDWLQSERLANVSGGSLCARPLV